MNNYRGRIIDTHTHIYPQKIALKATSSIGSFYDTDMKGVGTLENLLQDMEEAGVCKSFILSTATSPTQVRAINEFLIDVIHKYPDKFIAFGTVHPDMDRPVDEMEFMKKNKILGLKFHPDFQRFAVDDPKMDGIYSYASFMNIPIVFHAGDIRYHYSNPHQFLNIAEKFPNLKIIAAHFGGYTEWSESYEVLCGTDIYFDTSSSLFALDKTMVRKIISKHGIDKIFFASDFPMWHSQAELENIENLGLSDEEKEKILYKNAEAFLKSFEI